MQQSIGLAASVAALFFGSNVGLAAGGAAMVQNFRTLLFPGTDFRSALAQTAPNDGVTLCAKREPAKSRTRLAYLWAYRVPDAGPPSLSLPAPVHVPLSVKSTIPFETGTAATRAHDWSLVSPEGRSFPVRAKPAADAHSLELDLTAAEVVPGKYQLAAKWDWTTFQVKGDVHVHPLADLKAAALVPESRDQLVEGTGAHTVSLAGADFEFVEKLTLDRQPLEYKLPLGKRAGTQQTLETTIDTNRFKSGTYQLTMYQAGGKTTELPVRVLPSNPRIEGLPLRANLGEERQRLVLRGSGLGRVEKVEAAGAQVELGEATRDGTWREAFVHLGKGAKPGELIPFSLRVEGLESPLELPDVIRVAGPRPRIGAVNLSVADDLGVALREGELPAGSFASISMRVENLGEQPSASIECAESEKTLEIQTLRTGESRVAARLQAAGPETLFLSLDAGAIGRTGCTLTVVVETPATGRSDTRTLGRVVRLPKITGFTLTDERAGETSYAGVLTGYDLETIERTGWDPRSGIPVENLPKPVAGERDRQTLRIALAWPAPSPHAPVYIWLRGESEGRATRAKY